MKFTDLYRLAGLKATKEVAELLKAHEEISACKIVGWTSLVVGIAAIGLYVGREVRSRYKFRHRTPYDFFSHAGDCVPAADYGMGI